MDFLTTIYCIFGILTLSFAATVLITHFVNERVKNLYPGKDLSTPEIVNLIKHQSEHMDRKVFMWVKIMRIFNRLCLAIALCLVVFFFV